MLSVHAVNRSNKSGVVVFILSFLILFMPCITPAEEQEESTTAPDPIKLALEAPQYYEKINDYTATFYKTEFIDGKLLPEEKIFMKFRKPFDFYMKWLDKNLKGQESLYKGGKDGGKLLAHKGGWMGVVSMNIDPRGSLAMKNNHHPIFDAGLGSTINLIVRGLKIGLERKEVTVNYKGTAEHDGRPVYHFEGVFPKEPVGQKYIVEKGDDLWSIAEKFDKDMYIIMVNNKGVDDPYDVSEGQEIHIPHYYCHRIEVFLDQEWRLPVKMLIYDWSGNLYEKYVYSDLKLNVGLTDKDFDPENAEYNF